MKGARNLALFFLLAVALLAGCAEHRTVYNPEADAQAQIEEAKQRAQAEGKMILLQVGGDWCKWCVRLNRFIESHERIRAYVEARYVWVHIYYGKENRNLATMERLGNPHENGFPVFVVMDAAGEVRHIQPTGELESGESYSQEALLDFLERHAGQ